VNPHSNHLQIPGDFSPAQVQALVSHQWSLLDYLAWLGRSDKQRVLDGWWVGSLTTDLEHWAAAGVHTAAQLAAYLDAEVERERRKDAVAGWDQDWDWELHATGPAGCAQCGDHFTGGARLCHECAEHEEEQEFLHARAGWQPDPDDLDLAGELSAALDVRLVANRLNAMAVQSGWLSPG